MTAWQCVIGLEMHVQLATRTKLFSSCPAGGDLPPNHGVDAVSLGLPGTLPVLDAHAVELALRLSCALGVRVATRSAFTRKSYFYPDLPKNFQITQYEHPLGRGGQLAYEMAGTTRSIGLERIHLEEDAGRSVHGARTLIDLDRAGMPLVEVVTVPGLHHADEAAAALLALQELVRWIGVGEANLESGQLRCDVNVSVRRQGTQTLGPKVELKNLNSVRHLRRAIALEFARQVALGEAGEAVRPQTRGYDPDHDRTHLLREKEQELDYRYLPEPDLPPLAVDEASVRRVAADLGELPLARRARWQRDLGLGEEDRRVLSATRARADLFEAVVDVVVEAGAPAALAANWIRGELTRVAADEGRAPEDLGIDPVALGDLLLRVHRRELAAPAARTVLAALVRTGRHPDLLIGELGLRPLGDEARLRTLVRAVLDANPEQVQALRAGKHGLRGWLVARVLERSEGRADPRAVQQILQEELGS